MVMEEPQEAGADRTARMIAAERMTFFSDAVIAIALTLLALELPVPEGTSNADLLHSAYEHRTEYVAFLVSFVVIAAHWSGHHRVYRHVATLGGRLSMLNMYWLLMQVITPFATRVLTGHGAFATRFCFYAGVQSAGFLLFLGMLWLIRRHDLLREGTSPRVLVDSAWRACAFATGFLVSIPVALLTHYAYVCWIVAPPAGALLERVWRRR